MTFPNNDKRQKCESSFGHHKVVEMVLITHNLINSVIHSDLLASMEINWFANDFFLIQLRELIPL